MKKIWLDIAKNCVGCNISAHKNPTGEKHPIGRGVTLRVLGVGRKPPSVLDGILLSTLPLSSLNN